jgi:hypothetical protein
VVLLPGGGIARIAATIRLNLETTVGRAQAGRPRVAWQDTTRPRTRVRDEELTVGPTAGPNRLGVRQKRQHLGAHHRSAVPSLDAMMAGRASCYGHVRRLSSRTG